MAEVHRFPEHRRELIADGGRSALRATWHIDSGYVVVSLWRGDSCVATSHLTPKEAGRLASFITGGLADLAHEASLPEAPIATATRRPLGSRIRNGARVWRESIAWSLERLARRLR
jgi:hypothetical protein